MISYYSASLSPHPDLNVSSGSLSPHSSSPRADPSSISVQGGGSSSDGALDLLFTPLLDAVPRTPAELRLYFSDATACPRVPLLRFAHRAVGAYCGESGDRSPLCECAEVSGDGRLGAVSAHLSSALTSDFTPGPVEHTTAAVFRLFVDVLLTLDRHAPPHLRIDLAHRSEALTPASSHALLFSRAHSGLLLAGEERAQDRMQEAARALAGVAGDWSPLLFGKQEYLLGFAAAGQHLQLWAAERSRGAAVPVSERLNMATLPGRLAVLKAALKALSYLRCAARAVSRQRLLPLGVPEVFAHADGGWREETTVSADLSVSRTIQPWSLFVWSLGGPAAAEEVRFADSADAHRLAAAGLPGLVQCIAGPHLVASTSAQGAQWGSGGGGGPAAPEAAVWFASCPLCL